MRLQPDGFIGTLMAVESLRDAQVLLHGPIGCRRDAAFIAKLLFPKRADVLPAVLSGPFFRGMSRVPCTEVECNDYISGAIGTLEDALDTASSVGCNLTAVVVTPGMSLIGDNCKVAVEGRPEKERLIVFDAEHISVPMCVGFDHTLERILRHLAPVRESVVKGSVNLVGMSILMRDWDSAKADLVNLVESMGIRVLCCPGAGCTIAELKDSVNAEFNVIVCEEYCRATCDAYSELGIDIIDTSGAPVGPVATKNWVKAIAERFGVDPSPAISILDRKESRISRGLAAHQGVRELRGMSLGVEGDLSIIDPLVRWLYRELGLIPVYIRPYDGYDQKRMEAFSEFLEEIDCRDALTDGIPEFLEVMVCDGDTARRMEIGGRCRVGIDIAFPSLYMTDFVSRSPVGYEGILTIVDRIVNSRPLM